MLGRAIKHTALSFATACAISGLFGSPIYAADIGVTVDSRPIQFMGTAPREMNGSVLVPLRGVFEALGASVNYDPGIRTITARKGLTNIILPIGSTMASVNGTARTLSQPAQVVGGTTLVPLRFVAEALGAYVEWHAATSSVEIRTQDPHLSSLPPAPGSGPIVGRLTGIFTATDPPQITLRVNGQNTIVPLSSSTIILRSTSGEPGMQVNLNRLNAGDQVIVQRGPDGTAESITATYGEVRGTVKSIGRLPNGDSVITLDDGTTVELVQNAPVRMAGRAISLSDVMASEKVVIRTNPSNQLGYGVAVVTANNPNPIPPVPVSVIPSGDTGTVAVAVSSFSHDASRPLRAGDVLTATLNGTPGGKASFAIPGVVENAPMREEAPGVYRGSIKIPRDASVKGGAVLGKLIANDTSAPLIQASSTVTIDSAAPTVVDFSPAKNSIVDNNVPLIYATVTDAGGTGVDPNATRITLDGVDVTGEATVTGAFFNVRPSAPLAPGKHTVVVTLADNAGNAATSSYPFTVAASRTVQSFVSDAQSGRAIGSGTPVQFTLTAPPGGKAAFDVGALAKDIPMSETTPGVYVGTFTAPEGANATNVPVIARFTGRNGNRATTSLSTGLTIAAGKPQAPKITSPEDGSGVAETITVSGTSAPRQLIRVKVDYVSKALGGILAIRGSTGSKEVTADSNGRWSVSDVPFHTDSLLGNDRDTAFTITAVAVDANGDESPPASIQVRRT